MSTKTEFEEVDEMIAALCEVINDLKDTEQFEAIDEFLEADVFTEAPFVWKVLVVRLTRPVRGKLHGWYETEKRLREEIILLGKDPNDVFKRSTTELLGFDTQRRRVPYATA